MKINEKKIFLVLLSVVTIILFSNIISAEIVCCPETVDGALCQNVDISECAQGQTVSSTSCESSPFCRPGTCVNENTGICSSNTPKSVCEKDGGVWDNKKKGEIGQCQQGCCIIGSGTDFVSEVECANIAIDYGIDIKFNKNIRDEQSCISLASSEEKGACVVPKLEKDDCTIESKENCLIRGGAFYKDMLCSAPGLSDCKKSSERTCFGDDVYFLDTCGNPANIYDESKINDNDYWTDIKENYNDGDYDGDCDYNDGTVCEEVRGVAECVSLECENVMINGKLVTKQHGERWCQESPGTFPHILVDKNSEFIDESQREEIENGFLEYNIPGSRYYKATCLEGEVRVEACADFRNEICKESEVKEDYTYAKCAPNGWGDCKDIESLKSCEENVDCKWIPGYRYNEFEKDKLESDDIIRKQGSCVPLYAPGLNFWDDKSSSKEVCEIGSVDVIIGFRYRMVGRSGCTDNCEAIPRGINDYKYWGGLSLRNVVFPLNIKGFSVFRSLFRTNVYNTNEEWVNLLSIRGKSLGDCGYKMGINEKISGDSSEGIISNLNEDSPTLVYARDGWNSRATDMSDIDDEILDIGVEN